MYRLSLPPFEYHAPWDLTFAERCSLLQGGKQRVGYFYLVPDNSTFRYRVFNMVQAINSGSDGVVASWFTAADFDRLHTLREKIDVLVLCRVLYRPEVSSLISLFKASGVKVLYDIDDLVFDSRYANLLIESLDQAVNDTTLQDYFGTIGRYGATLQQADGAIATNNYLAEKMRSFSGLPTSVVPNFLNRLQSGVSEELWEHKLENDFLRDDSITIGYFSGSPTHNRDFQIAAHALRDVMRRKSRVRLRVVGYLKEQQEFDEFGERVEYLPFQDFLNLQRVTAESEICIAPLQDNEFTNCKSELKFFESAAVGTLTVASPTYTFRNAIVPGKTGFLSNSYEWTEQLEKAIAEVERGGEMAKIARTDVLDRYGWKSNRGAIVEAVFGAGQL